MQSNKNVFILIFVIVLLGGYVFFLDTDANKQQAIEQKSQVSLFENVSKDNFNRLIVDKQGETQVVLEKTGEQWFVVYSSEEKYPVLDSYVEGLYKMVEEVKTGEIISKNTEKYASFELDDSKKTQVSIYNDDTLLTEFSLGKSGATYPSQYFKLADSENVLLVKEGIKTYFERSGPTGWRDKTITNITREDIESMNFSFKRNFAPFSYTLSLSESVWKVTAPYVLEADQYLGDRLYSAAGKLTTSSFGTKKDLERLAELGLEEGSETLKVVFTKTDGETVTLLVGNLENDFYYARILGRDQVYKISTEIDIFTKQDLQRLKSKE